jgi:hypothetical protein
MKKIVRESVLLCLFLSLAVIVAPAAANNKLFAKGKWQVEFQAGWSPIAPANLNIMSDYWRHYLQFNYAQYYEILHQHYGNDFTYSGFYDRENLFPELKTILPLTLSIRYRLNRSLYLSLGLSYFKQTDTPQNSAAFQFQDSRPDTLGQNKYAERDYKYQYELAASGWVPALTIHYRVPLGQKSHFEVYLGGGPFFASCAYAHNSITKSTYPDGYWTTYEYNLRLQGNGVGIALSTGVRCGWQVSSHLEIFAGAGYDFRQASSIKGEASREIRRGDKESTPGAYTTSTWSGRWRIIHITNRTQWGTFEDDMLYIGENNPNYSLSNFTLDLSAFQLRWGISFLF